MIYATGDTHGNFQRFALEHFPEQSGMTKEDYMIICGDSGGVWDGGKKDKHSLGRLEACCLLSCSSAGIMRSSTGWKNTRWRNGTAARCSSSGPM